MVDLPFAAGGNTAAVRAGYPGRRAQNPPEGTEALKKAYLGAEALDPAARRHGPGANRDPPAPDSCQPWAAERCWGSRLSRACRPRVRGHAQARAATRRARGWLPAHGWM